MPGYRDLDYDVVVVGAGVTGLYQLHCLRKLGFRVRVLEAAAVAAGLEGLAYTEASNRGPINIEIR